MVPIIWTVIISYSGGKKSPPFHAAVNVLRTLDDASCEAHTAAMKQYEHNLIEYQQQIKASKAIKPLKPTILLARVSRTGPANGCFSSGMIGAGTVRDTWASRIVGSIGILFPRMDRAGRMNPAGSTPHALCHSISHRPQAGGQSCCGNRLPFEAALYFRCPP